MPVQTETATYDATIPQLQATDSCQGATTGGEGVLNTPLRNLANRTGWLKAQITTLFTDLTGYAPINSPLFTGSPRAPTPPQGDNSQSLVTTNWLASAVPVLTSGFGFFSTVSTPYGQSTSTEVSYQKFPNGRIEFYFHNYVVNGSVASPNGSPNKVVFAPITLPFTLPNGVLSAVFMPTDIGGGVSSLTPEVTVTLVCSGQSQVVLAAQGLSTNTFNQIALSGTVVGF